MWNRFSHQVCHLFCAADARFQISRRILHPHETTRSLRGRLSPGTSQRAGQHRAYATCRANCPPTVERELILETLRHCHGNRTHTANILGISIRTLRNKLNEYAGNELNIPPPTNGLPDFPRGAS